MPSRQKLFHGMLFALVNILSFDLVVQFIVICCYSMLTFVYEDANNVITATVKKVTDWKAAQIIKIDLCGKWRKMN